jgi:superfamily I DNA/RNA helicase
LEIIENGVVGDIVAFLTELTSAIAKPEIPELIEDVRIMSLHKSKGLSAPVTIIAGCVEGLLPKQPDANLPPNEQLAQLEEQRRLFYVGISRVKSVPQDGKPGTLILTYSMQMSRATAMGAGIQPAQFNYGDAHLHASRFIANLGPAAPPPLAG